jgi:glycine/D-amino acid oxidase-like deaminating enzyme
MSETADAIVIGAGIVGGACAQALAREGLSVTLVEPGVTGGGATAAGMGHIVVMDDSEAQFQLTAYSRGLWQQLAPTFPRRLEYEERGTIWVAADGEEMDAVRQKHAFYSGRGMRTTILDDATLYDAEPNLRPGLAGGLLVPDDAVLYAPCAAAWMIEQAGSVLRRGRVVHVEGGTVVLSDGSRMSAAIVICATGTAAIDLFPDLPVRPRKGHLAITDRYPGFVQHQLVELGYLKSAHGSAGESVAFNLQPRSTGQVLIGSSRQYGVTDSRIDAPILGRMLQRAIEYMPGLAVLAVLRTWTGFRAATDDKLPIIGPSSAGDRVYLATGHEGLGITTSLGTAQLIADHIAGRKPAIPFEPFLPARFLRDHAHA